MISAVIPTLNSETTLPATLAALVPAAIDGLIGDVVIADGGSSDGTRKIADACGAEFLSCARGRGSQLAAGARAARGRWLLFLHADTVLDGKWIECAADFMRDADSAGSPAAAAFRFKLEDQGVRPRILESLVGFRCRAFGLPYGDQGLLISRKLYNEIGGFKNLPVMEDVDLVRRLGRRRIKMLSAPAVTSAERYKRDGYVLRSLHNQSCLLMYFLGVPAERIAARYAREPAV